MAKRTKPFILSTEDVDFLKSLLAPIDFNVETELIYFGQVPRSAYLLVDGELNLLNQRNQLISKCEPNTLIGFNEIIGRERFNYTLRIMPGTKLLVLDKSTIKELINTHPSLIQSIELLKAS